METQRWCGPLPHLLLKEKVGELHLDGIKFPKDLPKGGKPIILLRRLNKNTAFSSGIFLQEESGYENQPCIRSFPAAPNVISAAFIYYLFDGEGDGGEENFLFLS